MHEPRNGQRNLASPSTRKSLAPVVDIGSVDVGACLRVNLASDEISIKNDSPRSILTEPQVSYRIDILRTRLRASYNTISKDRGQKTLSIEKR